MKLKNKIKTIVCIAPKYYVSQLKYKKVKIEDDFTLIKKINKDKYSLGRFGDGEFNIIYGGKIKFQQYDGELATRLKQILISKNKNFMVGIPKSFNSLKMRNLDSKLFWMGYLCVNKHKIYNDLDLNKTYYNALITRPYINYKNNKRAREKFENLKKIWADKDVIMVEGRESRLGVGNDLFNNSKSIERILCPSENAYSQYSNILNVVKQQNKDKLILIALGPTATVLAYDLCILGFQAIDIGHIDIEYEWFLRGCKKKEKIDGKYVNECNGRDIKDVEDSIYKKQIIEIIK